MSWGFFLDLDITLPTSAYEELLSITPATLPAGWWGFTDADLEHTFTGTEFDEMSFERTFGIFEHGDGCSKIVESAGGSTRVRFCMLLDKAGETQSAKVYAAFANAAATLGGTGYIQLINDGTYGGEAGVKVTLGGGTVARSAIGEDEHLGMMEEIAARAFGRSLDGDEHANDAHEEEPDPVSEPAAKNAAKPAAKKPAKKPAAKSKPSAKSKPAAKTKPAAKAKPAAKTKPPAKKPAKKKPAKPAKKKPAAKKPAKKKR